MKIEKISDTQIRCTLNRSDLVSREIKLSELAYGTEKAKDLFHDMIEQASNEFGFEADEVPLMIEAIPVSSDCIILIITKVDDPEELDAKFARFAPDDSIVDDEDNDLLINIDSIKEDDDLPIAPPDNFIPMAETISSKTREPETSSDNSPVQEDETPEVVTKVYSFSSWDNVSSAVKNLEKDAIQSSLFKSNDGRYFLVLTAVGKDSEQLLKACNILSEYGHKERSNYATVPYLREHAKLIIKENALRILTDF